MLPAKEKVQRFFGDILQLVPDVNALVGEAAIKLLYLGLRHIGKRWTMPIQNWKQAMSQLMIRFNKQFNPA